MPSPGFQVEIVMIDYDGTIPPKTKTEVTTNKESSPGGSSGTTATTGDQRAPPSKPNRDSEIQDKDDVFSDTESEGSVSSKKRHGQMSSSAGAATSKFLIFTICYGLSLIRHTILTHNKVRFSQPNPTPYFSKVRFHPVFLSSSIFNSRSLVSSSMDFTSNYDITQTTNFIRTGNFSRVALQFLDDLLKDSIKVVSELRKELNLLTATEESSKEIGLYVLTDTTYGSCCVDEVVSHVDADCVVHYGHTC